MPTKTVKIVPHDDTSEDDVMLDFTKYNIAETLSRIANLTGRIKGYLAYLTGMLQHTDTQVLDMLVGVMEARLAQIGDLEELERTEW